MNDHRTAAPSTGSRPVPFGVTRSPRRVLVVSADMGGGHNATAAALEESVGRVWPGSEIRRIDALDVMGGWVGDAFRRTYVSNVESTPWLYEFFYSSLWRHRWFAVASKRFVGTWCGRRLVRYIDAFDPDLVLSTYPLGTAGLAWLIRHRALSVPVASWVSDFSPHPFWVYRDIAMNYLADDAATPVALCAEPQARYRVSALPVTSRFHARDRDAARAELGLRPDAVVALIGCGSYAFGDVVNLVRTVAEVSPRIQVVAACGRNDEIRSRLGELGFDTDRVVPMGWTDRMPTVTSAADLVIGNAGGATALEAMASGVPIVLTEPIAAHGVANADLMATAGAAVLCSDRAALAGYLRTMVDGGGLPIRPDAGSAAAGRPVPPTTSGPPFEAPGRDTESGTHARVAALDADLASAADLTNAGRSPRYSRWPMRSSDAFFSHVETTGAAQELGVILELGERPGGGTATLSDIWRSMQPRTTLPSLRRILMRGRPGWRLARRTDVADHIDEVLPAGDGAAAAWDAAGDFFGERLPDGRPAWRMRLIRSGGTTLFAIKMHHCQADGISALGLLDRLLDPADDDPLPERRPIPGDAGVPARPSPLVLARGLAALAGRGFAPRHPIGAAPLSSGRMLLGESIGWPAVRALAARAGASVTETAIGLGAHVLQRILTPSGLLRPGVPVRAMIPVAMRPARLDREFGNWTGSLAADLDMADRSLAERIGQVRDELRRRHRDGEAPAAAAVMALAGALPTPAHRAFTRAVYHRRFFATVVSFMPGARRARWLAGSPVIRMAPVLPLPPRVPITLGMIVTDGRLDFGITLDPRLGLRRDPVARAVVGALGDAAAEAGRP